MNESVTAWEFECLCGFSVWTDMASDPTGDETHELVMAHVLECDFE